MDFCFCPVARVLCNIFPWRHLICTLHHIKLSSYNLSVCLFLSVSKQILDSFCSHFSYLPPPYMATPPRPYPSNLCTNRRTYTYTYIFYLRLMYTFIYCQLCVIKMCHVYHRFTRASVFVCFSPTPLACLAGRLGWAGPRAHAVD